MKTEFTQKQILAYYLTKVNVLQTKTIRSVFLQSLKNPHPKTSYELEAAALKDELEKEMNSISESGTKMVFLGEKGFPRALSDIPDAPIMLFVRCKDDVGKIFDGSRSLSAVIGTREPDVYGAEVTKKVVRHIAQQDGVIVSGLAVGVDTYAHVEALACGLPSIAVLPSPVDAIYPMVNRRLGESLAKQEGCALGSPFASGTEPSAVNFLLRNRVMAAICDDVVVTESRIKGGAMVTARLASDYGKKVYAIPGRVGDARSEGCNRLIYGGFAEMFLF